MQGIGHTLELHDIGAHAPQYMYIITDMHKCL